MPECTEIQFVNVATLLMQVPDLEQLSRIQGLLGCSDLQAVDFMSYLLALALVPKPRAAAPAPPAGLPPPQPSPHPTSSAPKRPPADTVPPAPGAPAASDNSGVSPTTPVVVNGVSTSDHDAGAVAELVAEVQRSGGSGTDSGGGGKRRRVLPGGKHAGHGKVDIWGRSVALLEQSLAAAAERAASQVAAEET